MALCSEEEAVHCGTVHCVMLEKGSSALWNCVLCYVGKRKLCIVELCMVLCWEEAVHCGIVHGVVIARKGTQL